jgi:hypothetical protein
VPADGQKSIKREERVIIKIKKEALKYEKEFMKKRNS